MPFTRKLVVGSTLSNERTGMAVILDAASGAGLGYNPEVNNGILALGPGTQGLAILLLKCVLFLCSGRLLSG